MGLAIDLGNGSTPAGQNPNDLGDADSATIQFGNDFQNYPLITSAVPEGGGTRVIGTLNSLASTVFDLDFYSNPACRGRPRALLQAETYIGSTQVTTDGSGNASFNVLLPTPIEAGAPVTASATGPDGNTSELWQEIIFRSVPGRRRPGDNFQQSDPRAPLRAGRDDDDRRNPVAGHLRQRARARLRRPRPHPGRRLRHRRDQSRAASPGTLRNGYVVALPRRPAHSLFDTHIAKLVAAGVTAGVRRRQLLPEQPT